MKLDDMCIDCAIRAVSISHPELAAFLDDFIDDEEPTMYEIYLFANKEHGFAEWAITMINECKSTPELVFDFFKKIIRNLAN